MIDIKSIDDKSVSIKGLTWPTPIIAVDSPLDTTTFHIYSLGELIYSFNYRDIQIFKKDGSTLLGENTNRYEIIKEFNTLCNVKGYQEGNYADISQLDNYSLKSHWHSYHDPVETFVDNETDSYDIYFTKNHSTEGNNIIVRNGKFEKVKNGDQVLRLDNNRTYTFTNGEWVLNDTETLVNNSVIRRTSDGRAKVNKPTEDKDAVNLEFMKNPSLLFNNMINKSGVSGKEKIIVYKDGLPYGLEIEGIVSSLVGNPMSLKGVFNSASDIPPRDKLVKGDVYVVTSNQDIVDSITGQTLKKGDVLYWEGSRWIDIGQVDINVNLSVTATETNNTINNDQGTSAVLNLAGDKAGLMSPAQVNLLNEATDNSTANTLVKRDASGNFKTKSINSPTDETVINYKDIVGLIKKVSIYYSPRL